MDTTLTIKVFGKAGCQKCKVLNSRLETLLKRPEWQEFRKEYCDVETEEGMVAFCQMECLNPQRIPALVITRTTENGRHVPLANSAIDQEDAVGGDSRLYQFLGLQTDYSPKGRGLITPNMIQAILFEAKEAIG